LEGATIAFGFGNSLQATESLSHLNLRILLVCEGVANLASRSVDDSEFEVRLENFRDRVAL
jgi:hypothetical protein